MNRISKSIAALVVLGILAGAAYAQFSKPDDAIKYRKAVMTIIAQHFGRMGAMIQGKMPYDQKVLANNAAVIENVAVLPWEAYLTPGSDKGKLYSPGDYGQDWTLYGADEPDVDYVESPGHFTEFAEAIKSGGQSMSNFPDYATPLTETVLLGNLAVWSGDKVEWDAENLEAKGRPDLAQIIQHEYREGWTL